jgi:drug/metabolite transporter (DMT)-like permease
MKWILIVLTVFSSSAGDVLCASGMSEGEAIPGSASSILLRSLRYIVTRRKVILGVLCYACAFFSLLGLLTVAPLSVAVPATALSFVVDTLGAKFLLHERVPVRRWIGVACVCTGVILAVNPAASGGPVAPATATVQAHKDQPRDHKPSAQNLDQ